MMDTNKQAQISQSIKNTLAIEIQALENLKNNIDQNILQSVEIIYKTQGRVILMGLGKTGHIARKIAATFASTGTPAFFIHLGEASHGDLGMIKEQDTIVIISYSGSSNEIQTLIPFLQKKNVKLIAITGNSQSPLAQAAHCELNIQVEKEACPNNLAPTTSTTLALALGDALAVACMELEGFTSADFALSHPSGQLGKRMILTIKDIMHKDKNIPQINQDTDIKSALIEMTEKKLGFLILKDNEEIKGVFSDGDLRRLFNKVNFKDLAKQKIIEHISKDFYTLNQNLLAYEALNFMKEKKINALPIVNDESLLVGAINIHDLFKHNLI